MDIQSETIEFLDRLANGANAVQRKLSWLIALGLICSGFLAWRAYDVDSATLWNAVKCGLIMLPSLVWALVWTILGQLKEAPELAETLVSRDDGLLSNIRKSGFSDAVSVRSIFGTLRAFRKEEGLGVVLDTIGSVTLLANPMFAIFAFLMMAVMVALIIIAALVLLI